MAILGIDLGTSSVKVIVLDTQGHLLGTNKADYEVKAPHPGWAESDPDEWWSATVTAVREVMAQTAQAEITAIGLSGQMHGVVPTHESGKPVRPALLWADNRAEGELARYKVLSPGTLRRLANPLVPGMTGPLLCWLAQYEASSYQEMRWALQPKDWLRFRLTDAIATDPSDASATLLYDLPADHWADEVIAALGLKRDMFPPLLASSALAGTLSALAAKALGLSPGLPVAAGAADTAAAALGTGLLASDPIQLTMGTGAQLIQLSSEPTSDPTLRTHLYRAADNQHWYAMAAVQNAGIALDWVRHTLAANWDELYSSTDSAPPGTQGLVFLPYLTRERAHHQNPRSMGAFLGMRIDHRREHVLHAALEGVALGVRVALEALPGRKQTILRLTGGGSVHPAWRQMLADVLGRELIAVDTPAASARGAALLGGIASGIWIDTQATASVAPSTYVVATPRVQQTAAYEEIYARYLRLSEANLTV